MIGNNAYPTTPLHNSVNDANAVSTALRRLGFQVETVTDTSLVALDGAVNRFITRLHPGGVGLFYYSGHGVQVENENFLIPVNFRAQDEAEIKYQAYSVSRLYDRMEKTGTKLNVLILDACRDNPYRLSRSRGGGLAAMDYALGTLIAYATSPGRTASDNPAGTNGLFTTYLLEALRQPGLKIEDVFKRVRERVYDASGGRQLPWVGTSVLGDFYLNPGTASSSAGPTVLPPQTGPVSIVAPDVGRPQIVWSQRIGIQSWRNNPVFVGPNLYSGSSGAVWNSPDSLDGFYAFEAAAGRRLWFVPTSADANDLAFYEGLIVGGTDGGELLGISALNGQVRWRAQLNGRVYCKPILTRSGVAVATGKGELYLVNLQNGAVLDRYQLDGSVRAGLASKGDAVWVATESGSLYYFYAFGKLSLQRRYSIYYPDQYGRSVSLAQLVPGTDRYSSLGDGKYSKASLYAAPLVLDDSVIIGIVRQTYYAYPALVAIRIKDGTVQWFGSQDPARKSFGNVRSSPAHYNKLVIFGNPYSNSIYALTESDGELAWKVALGKPMFQHWPSPVVSGDSVYIPRHDGFLHRLQATDGRQVWSMFLGDHTSAGILFLPGQELPGQNANAAWGPSAGSAIFATPAVSGKYIAVGTDEGYLYVLKDY